MNAPENSHLLSILVWLPAIAGAFVLFMPRQAPKLLQTLGVAVGLFEFGKSLQLLIGSDYAKGFRFVENVPWIPSLGIRYHLAVDGLSLWLILLTTFLTPLTLYVAFGSIKSKHKEFIASFLFLESAMIGAFVSLDMFLFYVFWEMMLVPMYLIIGVFGGDNKKYAAVKFFIYTFAGSVFMLLAILFMVAKYRDVSPNHQYSFDYFDLMRVGLPRRLEVLCFVAFAVAFAIKVPMFPLHTWLPDAHTEAPTGGSMILAAVMLKLGTYGFMRFALPLFPNASHVLGPVIGWLSVVGILYGAAVAWRQKDFKKLIAYSSVSHLGFVMLGIAARTPQSVTGAVLQSVNHGVSTGALFMLVGVIYDRRHTRELREFGGLAKVMPLYAACFVAVTMSSVGLPMTNGFVGEFLVITGTFMSDLLKVSFRNDTLAVGPLQAFLAAVGVLLGAVYMLECVQRVFFGPVTKEENKHLPDLNDRELTGLVPLLALIVFIGFKPQVFTSRIEPDVELWLKHYETKRELSLAQGQFATDAFYLEALPAMLGAEPPVAEPTPAEAAPAAAAPAAGKPAAQSETAPEAAGPVAMILPTVESSR